jgi:hypothetical protein
VDRAQVIGWNRVPSWETLLEMNSPDFRKGLKSRCLNDGGHKLVNSPGLRPVSEPDSHTFPTNNCQTQQSDDLAELSELWTSLPPEVRANILVMARANSPSED